ncbi:MAG: hypothetical protein FWF05_07315 [Oscillospiraceae bacterium]|nr:hypothetical protein [Oscillospiraceae bacterium]
MARTEEPNGGKKKIAISAAFLFVFALIGAVSDGFGLIERFSKKDAPTNAESIESTTYDDFYENYTDRTFSEPSVVWTDKYDDSSIINDDDLQNQADVPVLRDLPTPTTNPSTTTTTEPPTTTSPTAKTTTVTTATNPITTTIKPTTRTTTQATTTTTAAINALPSIFFSNMSVYWNTTSNKDEDVLMFKCWLDNDQTVTKVTMTLLNSNRIEFYRLNVGNRAVSPGSWEYEDIPLYYFLSNGSHGGPYILYPGQTYYIKMIAECNGQCYESSVQSFVFSLSGTRFG